MATSWKRLNRKTLVDTPFIKVHEDTVELPNGKVLDDYSVVKLGNPVIVIAVDEQRRVLFQHEYRYAHDRVLTSVPAGMIDAGETPLQAAERELLEETGYTAESFDYIAELYEYPTKLEHSTHIVRANNIRKIAEPKLEDTEFIDSREFSTLEEVKEKLATNEIKTTVIVSALYLSLPELRAK